MTSPPDAPAPPPSPPPAAATAGPTGGTPDGPIRVEVVDLQGVLGLDPGWLAGLARRTLEGEGVRAGSVSLTFVDDRAIRAINARHLGHDWATDVITFPMSDDGDDELAGEVVVSAETARRMAGELGRPPRDELALYVVHGLLHLCGHDDLAEDAAEAMRRRQDEVLDREGLCG